MNQAADSDRGEKTADNIRYGQNISESGQGGMTEGMGGDAADGMFFILFYCALFVMMGMRRRWCRSEDVRWCTSWEQEREERGICWMFCKCRG